jgi:secreted trypsin-like serine protease
VATHFVRTAPAANLVIFDAGKKHGSCFGDSGGPDFVTTSAGPRVVALISTGPTSCEAGLSVDTLVEPYLPWVQATSAPLQSGKSGSGYKLLTF